MEVIPRITEPSCHYMSYCDPLISHYSHCHPVIHGGLMNVIHLTWDRMSGWYFRGGWKFLSQQLSRGVCSSFSNEFIHLSNHLFSKMWPFVSKQVCPLAFWSRSLSLSLRTRPCSLHLCTSHIWTRFLETFTGGRILEILEGYEKIWFFFCTYKASE